MREQHQKTPAIMFQGICSNAGKSILAAAFCRILLRQGIRVAPFKSQNMSNNSYVTRSGEEIARAQTVQAQACRLDPDVRFSPILLKPNSDTGSQVILCGKPVGNMNVGTYTAFKPQAFKHVKACYDSLAEEYDAIVLEGAGSSAEVNLMKDDIVNMNMARYAQSPALLVGDIDRGGVFASFLGTYEIFNEWERNLTAGYLINRFRGEASLLDDAFTFMRNRTGKDVLGVVPYIENLGLPEEDSVTFKQGYGSKASSADDSVEIAVIDLPHISNYTDIDPFLGEPDVNVRIVRLNESVGEPDAVILPGSKNTISDLEALQGSGLSDEVTALATRGTVVVGICGGFQMIGDSVSDPACIETDRGTVRGLSLLPITTEMMPQKELHQTTCKHALYGHEVHGYEIHHGHTVGRAVHTIMEADGRTVGLACAGGHIWGAYLHGLFDADPFRRAFIDDLRTRKGLREIGQPLHHYDIEAGLDCLADVVQESIQLDRIMQCMGL